MTPEEKRKYRWLKPLAYTVAWGIEYPLRVALTIILLLPALICEQACKLLQAVHYFLCTWIVSRPFIFIFTRLGFNELHMKAKRDL